ncbi:MAG: phytanoyl-CoA dioxygenase family protein [Candidatus Obscuribacterales bacterium]|nr:phytanoyl-CoA dioxygenase family protein [Candidatus Obscuribacterales bacterium]
MKDRQNADFSIEALDESLDEALERAGRQLAFDGAVNTGLTLPKKQYEFLLAEIEQFIANGSVEAGRRGMLACPAVQAYAQEGERLAHFFLTRRNKSDLAEAGRTTKAVRAIFFDKNPERNWYVTWHQDLTIALKRKVETPGYSAWSMKDDIVHVQPPVAVLEEMVALRLHFDDCDNDNGPLKIICGSHKLGRLEKDSYSLNGVAGNAEKVLTAAAGQIIAMKPLVVHASSKSVKPLHRRVLHVEYAACSLPSPLEFAVF